MEWDPPALRKSFDMTIDDHVETQRLLAQQRAGNRTIWTAIMFWWTVFFVPAFFINEDHRRRLGLSLLQSGVVGVSAIVFLLWYRNRAWQSHFRSHYGPGPYTIGVEIDEHHLIYRSEGFEQRFAWSTVSRLANHPDELRIFLAKFGLARIPNRVFDTAAEKRQWMETIEKKTGLAFS